MLSAKRVIHAIRRIPPGVTLLFLAPVLGELVSAHQTPLEFINPMNFLLLSLPYGFGALVVRELTVKWEKGWPSLLLLGLAYGIYEEAIVVYSVFDPQWKELGSLSRYGFVAGVNWTWAALTIHFHTLISISSGIIITELLYPAKRHRPWLKKKFLIACFAGLILWVPALGYIMIVYTGRTFPPPALYSLACLLIILLVWVAYRIPEHLLQPNNRSVPWPVFFFITGLVNMSVFFFTVFLTADHSFPPLWLTMLFLICFDGLSVWLVLYFSGNGYNWDERHVLALIAGFLGFFIYFCFNKDFEHWAGRSIVGIFAIVLFWQLYRFVSRYVKSRYGI